MVKSIIAVVAGFVLTGVLNFGTNALLAGAGVIPPAGEPVGDPGTLVLISAYVAVFGILGCYVTAWLAPSRPLLHALVVGGLALAMSIPVSMANWDHAPAAFNLYNLLAVMPYAYAGGRLRERQVASGSGRPSLA